MSEKRLSLLQWQKIKSIPQVLSLRLPPPGAQLARIRTIERNVGLPVKTAVLSVLAYYFFFSNWVNTIVSGTHLGPRERVFHLIPPVFFCYVILNGAFATLIMGMRNFSFKAIQRIVFVNCLIDALFLAALTVATEGFGNPYLYWVFLVLIVRNTVSISSAASQLALNIGVSASYLLAGLADFFIRQKEFLFYMNDQQLRRAVEVDLSSSPWDEAFLLRLLLLVLVTICCYGIQVLQVMVERQRGAKEEAQELTARQEQLRAAGRLAAEIAHQLKNPLSIINNAAYTLQKTVKEGKTITQQIRIIREEVEKSDRIITELMGYARLSEGQVEKLDITEELDRAIEQVFPTAAKYDVRIKRDYGAALPAILAQRGHLSEAFVNILQNAREAMNGHGEIEVGARYADSYAVEITIKDSGPGIAPDKLAMIFEAYFTTKEKGTGLGLAIARHNTELYNGTLDVRSEPGKGACFVVRLPAKTVFNVRK